MKISSKTFHIILLFFLASFTLMSSAEARDKQRKAKIKVVSYNLYVGADIFRVFSPAPCGVPQAVNDVHNIIQATNFPERAEAIADQIQMQEPHVIGLQEVSLLRTQFPGNSLNPDGSGIDFMGDFPADPRFTFKADATDVSYDYLEILMDALSYRGLDYSVVWLASTINADTEFPAIEFDEFCTALGPPTDVRLTDRDVMLVRSDLVVNLATSKNFEVNTPIELPTYIPTPSGFEEAVYTTEFTRGWGALNVTIKDHQFSVLNTHLEVGDSSVPTDEGLNLVQYAQALEVGAASLLLPQPRFVIGDINSPPQSFVTDRRPAYYLLTSEFGLTDLWEIRHAPNPDNGYTCCQDEMLDNTESELDERIDVIFADFGPVLVPDKAKFYLLGDQPGDTTPSGLWPSDHAGVASKVEFER